MLLLQCPQVVWAAAWAVCTDTTPRLNKTKIPFDRVKGDFFIFNALLFNRQVEPSACRVQQDITSSSKRNPPLRRGHIA